MTENGTPQGSVISPLLFIIMRNDVFERVDKSIHRFLFADDGAQWFKGWKYRACGAEHARCIKSG